MRLMRAMSIARAHGFDDVRVKVDDEGTFLVDMDKFTLVGDDDGLGQTWQVIVWTGAYPFAEDQVLADLEVPFEQAVRYARWIQARERRYEEQFERMWTEVEEDQR